MWNVSITYISQAASPVALHPPLRHTSCLIFISLKRRLVQDTAQIPPVATTTDAIEWAAPRRDSQWSESKARTISHLPFKNIHSSHFVLSQWPNNGHGLAHHCGLCWWGTLFVCVCVCARCPQAHCKNPVSCILQKQQTTSPDLLSVIKCVVKAQQLKNQGRELALSPTNTLSLVHVSLKMSQLSSQIWAETSSNELMSDFKTFLGCGLLVGKHNFIKVRPLTVKTLLEISTFYHFLTFSRSINRLINKGFVRLIDHRYSHSLQP